MERQLFVVVKRIGILRGFAALAAVVLLLSSAGGSDLSVLHARPAPGQAAAPVEAAAPTGGQPAPAGQPAAPTGGQTAPAGEPAQGAAAEPRGPVEPAATPFLAARHQADLAAMAEHRPAHPFWEHVFMIPDGRILYASGVDGRLLASFPANALNWAAEGVWYEPALRAALDGVRLPSGLGRRRDRVADLLEPLAGGRVIHNATRGGFIAPNADRYGRFIQEWVTIYERFGVSADIGLAKALLESGLNGRARSRADALGFCQWLRSNWNSLDRLDPNVIEVYNQTTQAPYCAAHLTILSTMYGSVIPALSEHHAGGVNVGRVVINGMRLGGADTREQYFLGVAVRARPAERLHPAFPQFVPELRSRLVPVFRDGVRQRRQREAVDGQYAAGGRSSRCARRAACPSPSCAGRPDSRPTS